MQNSVEKKFLFAFERASHFYVEDPYDPDFNNEDEDDEFGGFDNDTESLCDIDWILGEVRTSYPRIEYNDKIYFVKSLTDNNDEYHIHVKELEEGESLRGYMTVYNMLEYFDVNNGGFEEFQVSIIGDDGSLRFITNEEFKVHAG